MVSKKGTQQGVPPSKTLQTPNMKDSWLHKQEDDHLYTWVCLVPSVLSLTVRK